VTCTESNQGTGDVEICEDLLSYDYIPSPSEMVSCSLQIIGTEPQEVRNKDTDLGNISILSASSDDLTLTCHRKNVGPRLA
jgi:hypothetical protein